MSTTRMDGVDVRVVQRLQSVSVLAAVSATTAGVLVCVDYFLGLERLLTSRSPPASMKPSTAIAVAMLGGAVILDRMGRVRLARLAGTFAVVIGASTLADHILNVNIGIVSQLGRPSIATSLAVSCGGAAVLLLDVDIRGRFPTPWLAAAVAIVGLHAIAGYAYGVSALHELARPTLPAVLTAFSLVALGLAILLARPDRGAATVLVSDTLGGYVVRRLLPAVAGLMLVLGWLRLLGEDAGLYGTVTGIGLHAGANLTVMTFVVWAIAVRLERVDLERRRTAGEMRELIENAPDGVVVRAGDTIVYCSRALEGMLGRPSSDLIGKGLGDLVDPPDRERLQCAVASDGSAKWGRVRARRPNGELRLLDVARFPDVHFGGSKRELIVLRDVTERVAIDAQLGAADRLATIGMLAAGVGHEINNPLTALILQLQMLARERGAASQEISDAQLCANKIQEIVRDLLTLSRPGDDRVAPIPIEPVLETSLRIASNELRGRARVIRDYKGSPHVVANEARLGQVVLNLIINAAHAIPEGESDTHFVRVATETDPRGWAVLEVSDNGRGIEPDVERRLFEPFFSTKASGTGLGLSISHRIVTALGGEIEVKTCVGAGSTFRVCLPPASS